MSTLADDLKRHATSGVAFASTSEEIIWRSEAITLMMDAAREIERIEKLSGGVSAGPSFAQLKETTKTGSAASKTPSDA